MIKPTRTRILEYLQGKQAATPYELAHALHLTPANIRYHIAILEAEGAITSIGEKRETPRGRPSRIFSLHSETVAHNLAALASALLDEGVTAGEDPGDYYRRVAARMAPVETGPPAARSKRLVNAVRQLNRMNYLARWEARLDAPRVILGRCPYAALLPGHPEVCQVDAHLLEALLGSEVTKTAHLEPTPQGLRQCVFKIMGGG